MATDQTTGGAVEVSSSPQRPPTPAEQRANEHAGTTDTEVLVRDIEKTREELAVTIDAIVDRVSPKNVVARTKQQANERVTEATEVVKERASAAAETVKEKATTAAEAAKAKAATVREQVKDKVSGSSDSEPVRSPLAPATSVAVGAASPVTPGPAEPAEPADAAGAPVVAAAEPVALPPVDATPAGAPSPLPPNTVSVDAGAVPPPEPAPSTGSLADAAEATPSAVEPAGAEPAVVVTAPGARPSTGSGSSSGSDAVDPALVPVYAGTGAAAAAALLLLLLGRRRRRRRLRR